MSLYVGDRQVCTLDRCHINTIDSPDDEHRGARNMYRIGINIYEKRIVPQIGYLQEMNRDARSTEHEIMLISAVWFACSAAV